MITQYYMTGVWINSFYFLLELSLSSMVLSYSKHKFSLKRGLIALFLFLLIILFVPSFPTDGFKKIHPVLSIIFEILLLIFFFLSVSFLTKFVFHQSFEKMIFVSIASYSIQNLIYNLISLFLSLSKEKGFYVPFFSYIQEPISILFCLILSFFLRKKLHSIDFVEMNNFMLLSILLLAILEYSILGHLVESFSFSYLAIYKYYATTADLLILYLQFSLLAKQSYKRKYYMTEMLREKDRRNYEIKKNTIEEMNQRVHDLKHILSSITPYMNQEKLYSLQSSVRKYEAIFRTGCLPLDVVLADKWEYCQKNDIRFTFLGDGKELDFMEEGDLYILFTNIIDNAIDALIDIKDENKRTISLTLSRKENVLLLLCQNYYLHPLIYNSKGNIMTSKDNKEFHGYGLKSISSAIEKYDGHLTITSKDNIFSLSILFENRK